MRIKFLFTVIITVLAVSISFAQNIKYEAEDAELYGVKVVRQIAGYSGTGYVTGFDNDGDKVVFNFDWEDAGKYQLYIAYASPHGDKDNLVFVNGDNLGNLRFSENKAFSELSAGNINLKNGKNVISIEKSWGWFELDYIRIASPLELSEWDISPLPINANATSEAISLKKFLVHNFGKTTFAGQFQSDDKLYTNSNSEIYFLKNSTGKYPAVYGNDLINYSPSRVERGSTSKATEDIIKWSEETGGMVTLTWHWNAPSDLYDTEENKWWSGFYTRATSFDIASVLSDPNSERYQLLIRDIDAIAVQLLKYQEKNIPILWRPLHEAEGTWFWWGAKGPEACVKLWKLLYDRLSNHHQINNLLWVWTTTDSPSALDWYPGDEFVDILGVDVYLDDGDYSSSSSMFEKLRNLFEGRKILTMSENGTIPDPDKMFNDEAHWSYFCTWVGNFIFDGKKNTHEHIVEVFNHEMITTADELPDHWDSFVGEEINVLIKAKSFTAFPSPFKDEFLLDFKSETPHKVSIFDSSGNAIQLIDTDEIQEKTPIRMKNYPPGIYFVRVQFKDAIETKKIIKY